MNMKSIAAMSVLAVASVVWTAQTRATPLAEAGVAAPAMVDVVPEQATQTVSLNVIYPNHAGAKFDINYYRATHIPLAMKVMKADSVMLIEGVPTGNTAPPYAMIAHFQFASLEALQAATASPSMADVRADIARFTDIVPTVMIGKP